MREINTYANQATLINFKDESQTNVYPGVSYRAKVSSAAFEFSARWPGKANVNINDNTATPKKIILTRKNGKIYYSINNSNEALLIETPAESLTEEFKTNLTFGASINASGNPFRFFNGVVSDIKVILYDN